ncbi:FKBP-type peptidyl-prolyl cis-trans isomerase [Flammeovirga yaeyamensis]|uniref:peptidylprolyl isomerase n=1 Tax=Flammeovirga yaeyamensis TaxID=367791 RepID=A0AAX1N7M3_9BACT|nr:MULTISPECIES: FKBP-type peptidyl-prolyl cis-trans isomerase [Flammeovirga]ANQ50332.1 hypothetical protein MY04_2964 [Flammeovirga sp. MY04]MBB3699713.1 FKBP-type peptidyl-prolyl cis-trans isomerase [Flammeovirga yaeyamensis]NMF36717.1 hypothetical protein [Flammeovirga yaeyamensis]QWG02240.1 FKBP-type peptidyl-prolyl cis-trans isomerase [Flammeovirga yaeyamensis]
MNNTYNKFFKFIASAGFLLALSGCLKNDIVDYVAQDTQTLENYLNDNDIEYFKTSSLGSGYGVYITPNAGILFPPAKPDESGHDTRIIETTLDLRRFDQSLIGNEQVDTDPDNLVTQVFLKDSTYTFAMRRGAICLGYMDAVINLNGIEVPERVYIPSYLAFGGTASTGIGLEFNDIVTAENLKIKAVRNVYTQAEHEKQLAITYAKDSLGINVDVSDTLFTNKSIVEEEYGKDGQLLELPDYIVKKVVTEGSGDVIAAGDTVNVRYEGKFIGVTSPNRENIVFDSNEDADSPLNVVVYESSKDANDSNASSQVINGWYKALRTMKKGETAIFVLPSHTAYWDTGDNAQTFDLFKKIRPFKTLVFEITVEADED